MVWSLYDVKQTYNYGANDWLQDVKSVKSGCYSGARCPEIERNATNVLLGIRGNERKLLTEMNLSSRLENYFEVKVKAMVEHRHAMHAWGVRVHLCTKEDVEVLQFLDRRSKAREDVVSWCHAENNHSNGFSSF